MRLLPLPCVLLLASLNLNAQTDTSEPPIMLDVSVGGKVTKVGEGSAFDVNGTPVTVRVSDTKHLSTGTMSFDYPRHFGFEYDGSTSGMKQWSLDGNNVVILIFELDSEGDVDDFEEGMIERFGKKNCKASNTSRKLGGREVSGRRLDINMAGTALYMDMLELPAASGGSTFLFFQDTKSDSGGVSDEGRDTMDVVDRSITYK